MDSRVRLLETLSDGRTHDATRLAKQVGLASDVLEREIDRLRTLGLDILLEPPGYRLAEVLELLHCERIVAEMPELARPYLGHLEVLHEVDSTNRFLMDAARDGVSNGSACFGEVQTAGRGRRGRRWFSPFGQNLCFSLLWCFQREASALQGLSLALGVAVAEALTGLGAAEIQLKWPNDLYWRGRKLGGLLTEVSACGAGAWHVVCGIGLNIGMSGVSNEVIDQPWVSLRRIVGSELGRNRVAGTVLGRALLALERFAREGLTPFRAGWASRDLLRDKIVSVDEAGGDFSGRVLGIDDAGHLLMNVDGVVRSVAAGDVSVRAV